jgi:hypothetical protein
MRNFRCFALLIVIGLLAAGCSHDLTPASPNADNSANKNGTETLGPPDITIATGSGIAEGGVGMQGVGAGSAMLNVAVPAGATINQVLVYWSGGTAAANGDDTIVIDGTEITGQLIGGPTVFYDTYAFYAYRQDITNLNLVAPGANSLEVSGMNFEFTFTDENNGVSVLVIYDDGTTADLRLVDGLDLAYFQFSPTLNATAPQTFTFGAEAADRVADLLVLAGSVQADRPNRIVATTSGGDQVFVDPLTSSDGMWWDSLTIPVDIPAGADYLTVQLFSAESVDPLGASMTWIGSALSVPTTTPQLGCLGDFVWHDLNQDGIQDTGEAGVPGVTVHLLDCDGGVLAETTTDADGRYLFCELEAGDYNVHFVLPAGWAFSPQDQGSDDAVDSDADPVTGATACTSLDSGETDLTWDAGIYQIPQDGCTHTIGYWKTHAGIGPQDDVVTPLLPQWLGDADGPKSIAVTTPAMVVALMDFDDGMYGPAKNGISKLYAQLLGAKLSIADGAADADVSAAIVDADAFLAMHSWEDWSSLTREQKNTVLSWQGMFDDFNNGDIGPGHCDHMSAGPTDAKWAPVRVSH